jgi:hypothetical protein
MHRLNLPLFTYSSINGSNNFISFLNEKTRRFTRRSFVPIEGTHMALMTVAAYGSVCYPYDNYYGQELGKFPQKRKKKLRKQTFFCDKTREAGQQQLLPDCLSRRVVE